jgi:hypothetical protein
MRNLPWDIAVLGVILSTLLYLAIVSVAESAKRSLAARYRQLRQPRQSSNSE